MASVVRATMKAIKDKGVVNFFRELKQEGYMRAEFYASGGPLNQLYDYKCLPDGNLLQTKIHNIGARLVGVDKFGNKYYEKADAETQYGRHRWVEYAEKGRYNASQVPAEWHGWLHYITDHTGDQLLMLKPKRYGVEHRENFSGEGDEFIYHSKGHALNPGQRDWTRYQPWEPTKP